MRNSLLLYFSIFCIVVKAQVPVSKEPRHHVVFENSKARILNVLLPVGDTSEYHVHSTPSVFIRLSNTKTGSQLINEQPIISGASIAGSVLFENLSVPNIRIHRVWNMDTSVFHVMDIELLTKDSGFTQKPFLSKYTQLETDTPWVRTYRIELAKKEQLVIAEKRRSFILVTVKDEKVNLSINKKAPVSFLSAGDFFWVNPGDRLTLINSGDSIASFALVEIK
jgi:hypothetical protein